MSKLRMPYQCLKKCGDILIAARGSSIDSFSLKDHSLLSTWRCPSTQSSKSLEPAKDTPAPVSQDSSASVEIVTEQSTPPAKRRKLSTSGPEKPNQQNGKRQNNRLEYVSSGLEAPAVIALAVTRNGKHVIAVTGEDKSIRVFENAFKDSKHELIEISQRAMPKRPCAVAITPDDTTIISGDKFGDVYSLPLIPLPVSSQSRSSASPAPSKPFIPAATTLTVHSQRNLKALENQQRSGNKIAPKEAPTFEHTLLLGHVSMLTDLLLTSVEGRGYILTADRDEHIRVSRGVPQAHIIESFCLGHTEFVSRICIVEGRPGVLVSGGGDDELFVWGWVQGKLVSKADLNGHVEVVYAEKGKADGDGAVEGLKIAVSNILSVRVGEDDLVVVTCEGVPAVFTFLLTPSNTLEHIHRLQLPRNALAITIADNNTLVVAIDTIHEPFFTKVRRPTSVERSGGETNVTEAAAEPLKPLQAFAFEEQRWVPSSSFEIIEQVEDDVDGTDKGMLGKLGNLLYSLDNLRKRDGDSRDEE
ncbi:hypothetical protein B0O99DRAFT_519576 [Bisporella sp. PMI_857]|nr:hypothetical protein B0O99DRAFT_519576 [Bisporella sp. PMI_857]